MNLASAVLTHISSPTGANSLNALKEAIGTYSSKIKAEKKQNLDDALKPQAQTLVYEPIGEAQIGTGLIQSLTGIILHSSFNNLKTLTQQLFDQLYEIDS